MLLNELFMIEGGNVFPETQGIPKSLAPLVMKRLMEALPPELQDHVYQIGSAGHKPYSGDLDVMLDNQAVQQWCKRADPKVAKTVLQQAIEQHGLPTRLHGISIHVRVPMQQGFAQADIILVDDAKDISKLHQHDYAAMGNYTGSDIQQLISSVAKGVRTQQYPNGLMWSGFQGLFTRNAEGKKDQLVSRDPDQIAQLILNPNASGRDLLSPQAIISAIPQNERQAKLAAAEVDFRKNGKTLPMG